MQKTEFPVYRHSINGLNWYRIDSPTELTEVQRIGRRYVVHRITALAYPEQLRIRDLLYMTDGHVVEERGEVVEELIRGSEAPPR